MLQELFGIGATMRFRPGLRGELLATHSNVPCSPGRQSIVADRASDHGFLPSVEQPAGEQREMFASLGLKAGDVIVEIDGRTRSPTDTATPFQGLATDASLLPTLDRGGQRITLNIVNGAPVPLTVNRPLTWPFPYPPCLQPVGVKSGSGPSQRHPEATAPVRGWQQSRLRATFPARGAG